jgi:small conductance mechanosensitive channel
MKKNTIIFTFILLTHTIFYSQDWLPAKLKNLESKLQELQIQVSTLDEYAPRKFPEFDQLDRTNQLVERIDFNKRKFDLLINQYNLVEDGIFPFILKFSRENPSQKNKLVTKLQDYTGNEKNSILRIQKELNQVALLIERLEKELEKVQILSKNKEIQKEKQKEQKSTQFLTISEKIQKLEEDQNNFRSELKAEANKLSQLNTRKTSHEQKIAEKSKEIELYWSKSNKSQDILEKDLYKIAAKVREIRLNGLEIPRLNSTKTFIYLANTKIETLKAKIENSEKEISSLKQRNRKEVQKNLLKGIVVILIAVIFVFLLIKISRQIGKRFIKKIESSTVLDPHRKQRYQTLFSIVLSIIKITLWILAVLWVLGELNIDYAPFLVAAGGISLAIGFGAQSLVKDIVAGFFILMEEQLALGDYVKIDDKSGSVEKISLRTIRLRSLDGTLHIIPNGNISKVSNLTHKWSRAVIEIGVSYEAKTEQVMKALNQVCQQIYRDIKWRSSLIEEPIPQGILSFGESAVNFRILAKTVPGKQWEVDREIKIRIKKTFDQMGIEIPYPFVNIINRSSEKPEPPQS